MGAGMGAGIAIGVASGEKRAVQQIRDHMLANELTIHDRMGKEVDLDQVLNEATRTQRNQSKRVVVTLALVIVGLIALALTAYLFLQM